MAIYFDHERLRVYQWLSQSYPLCLPNCSAITGPALKDATQNPRTESIRLPNQVSERSWSAGILPANLTLV
jgi:hypothetical protein